MTKPSRISGFASPAASPCRPVHRPVHRPARFLMPRPARILVLDKNEVLRGICVELLAGRGYEVDAAADGQAGWEALLARPYDLLITEHDLPKLSGLELIQKVCAARLTPAIIIASDSLSSGELRRHPATQIALSLPKPYSPDDLVRTVQELLGEAGPAGPGAPPRSAPNMKQIISALRRALEKLTGLWVSKSAVERRASLKTEAHERETSEAERLDRLRNPRDYQGR